MNVLPTAALLAPFWNHPSKWERFNQSMVLSRWCSLTIFEFQKNRSPKCVSHMFIILI